MLGRGQSKKNPNRCSKNLKKNSHWVLNLPPDSQGLGNKWRGGWGRGYRSYTHATHVERGSARGSGLLACEELTAPSRLGLLRGLAQSVTAWAVVPRVASARTPACCPHQRPCAGAVSANCRATSDRGSLHPNLPRGPWTCPSRPGRCQSWWKAGAGGSLASRQQGQPAPAAAAASAGFRSALGCWQRGKGRGRCLGTHLARLSLGPAETGSEKKGDGKAIPVLPKDYFRGVLRGGWQRIKDKRIQCILKMWKC